MRELFWALAILFSALVLLVAWVLVRAGDDRR
jgi:hypothetical protein